MSSRTDVPSGSCRNLLKDARRLRKNISTFQTIPTTTPFKQPLCRSEGSNVLDDLPPDNSVLQDLTNLFTDLFAAFLTTASSLGLR